LYVKQYIFGLPVSTPGILWDKP